MASSLFKGQKNLQNNINSNIISQAKNMMNDLGQMKGIMSMLSGKGMNPEQAVRAICKERGIDVDEFMNSLKGK